MKFKLKSR